jgi:hypothetical protein
MTRVAVQLDAADMDELQPSVAPGEVRLVGGVTEVFTKRAGATELERLRASDQVAIRTPAHGWIRSDAELAEPSVAPPVASRCTLDCGSRVDELSERPPRAACVCSA